ncbi:MULTISPECIES: AraC family transcriptional regulator [Staphylococcus]|jgi:AraC-like DNA-binding protein|uniref:AraC family transcriptional regulator n=2 Tax=Staphylococcus nepalensis TaxID=214473 RepID=A0A291JGQ9_9STAP|nr:MULTISPECIES: AraC family transcriptional regulator [Staphylococcus]VDG65847.1 transcriptional regulator [Lacrimispora indolis]ATH58991.1 AraC family transcriptional regulator [Staphylococcus nepalensis]ATH64082.1 AraC family transcriptional regulator [Staphylococcus nepalensis]AWI43443.1 AraC family transcriptional regulator [Staphylococcus nepalensis]MBO1206283.1 AraC family transcriptional regulator [Staphylococcus nepalensis]
MQVLWKKFQKKHIDADLVECGIEIGVPNVGYKYSVIKEFVLHIVTHGEGVFIYNGKKHALKEGDMFLLEKGMDVEYRPSFSNPWTYYWIGLSGKQILDYLQRCHIVDKHVIMNQETSEISHTIQKICNLSKSIDTNNSNDILIMQYLYDLAYKLQKQFPKIFSVNVDIINEDIQNAVTYINANYQNNIMIVDVADYVNVTRSHLFRLFKKNLNCSPKAYLTYIRMYHASQLLIHSNILINEIARQVGYKDPLLFSKSFTKHFKISASEYRNQFANQCAWKT